MIPHRIDPNRGEIYSLRGGGPIRSSTKQGYVQLRVDGKYLSVHRLIWEAVNGPIPDGLEINHINGITNDNRIENLELVTRSENAIHAYRTGLSSAVGEKNGRALLTEGHVRAIKRLLADGRTQKYCAELFEVSRGTVNSIARGKNWQHVKDEE